MLCYVNPYQSIHTDIWTLNWAQSYQFEMRYRAQRSKTKMILAEERLILGSLDRLDLEKSLFYNGNLW